MSAAVAEYRALCEALAARIVRPGRMSRTGVEHDDLVQEGLINVWGALSAGRPVGETGIRRAMLDYVKKMGREKRGGSTEFTPYIEEFHDDEDEGR